MDRGVKKPLAISSERMLTPDLKSPASMERIVILSILIALLVIHVFVENKLAFLGFYYLPVLLAGYFCGKRTALLLGILAVFVVVLYSVVEPGKMAPEIPRKREQLTSPALSASTARQLTAEIRREKFKLHFSLVTWGGFLVLSAIAASMLYEQKQRRVQELRSAYIGVLEILTKYLELADRYSVGRSIRVADTAAAMARRLGLGDEETENVRIAALLHDMGHKDISALILGKSAQLGRESDAKVRTYTVTGDEVLRSVSSVLEGVMPIVNAYREYFVGERREPPPGVAASGAEIIAVARAYDDMITGSPTRKAKSPRQALQEIKGGVGKEFDREIVEAFEKAVEAGEAKGPPGELAPET
jgi:hypothetical protein